MTNEEQFSIEFGRRLKEIRLSRRRTLKELGKAVGISESNVQRYEIGHIKKISAEMVFKFAQALHVPETLLLGLEENNAFECFPYYFLDVSVSAGAFESVESIRNCPQISVPSAMLGKYAHDHDIVFMTVNGESMNRIISNHSVVVVKTGIEKEAINNGDIVVASENGEYTIKRFINDVKGQRIILRPDSTDESFSDIIIPYASASDLRIFGKVVIYSVIL